MSDKPTACVIDRGIWDIEVRSDGTICHISNKGEWFPSASGSSGRSHKTMLAHANLIADAFNVFAETGKTPKDMQARIKELEAHIESLLAYDYYSAEYDGQMISICPSCGKPDGEHTERCDFATARAALSAERKTT